MRRIVILESPYRGSGIWPLSWFRRRQNISYGRAALLDSLGRGEAPFASHLLYTQPGVLRDYVDSERELGINAGHEMLQVADAMVVYIDLGVSSGMKKGMERARDFNIPVELRTLYPDRMVSLDSLPGYITKGPESPRGRAWFGPPDDAV